MSKNPLIIDLISDRNNVILNALINNCANLFEEIKTINSNRQNIFQEPSKKAEAENNNHIDIINNLISSLKAKYNELQRRLL